MRLLAPELLLLEDELVLGEGVEKHTERSIGSGELQIDDSVEDITVKERESAKCSSQNDV